MPPLAHPPPHPTPPHVSSRAPPPRPWLQAIPAATMFADKGWDNVYLLSGGLRVFAEKHPFWIEGDLPEPPISPSRPCWAPHTVGRTLTPPCGPRPHRRRRWHVTLPRHGRPPRQRGWLPERQRGLRSWRRRGFCQRGEHCVPHRPENGTEVSDSFGTSVLHYFAYHTHPQLRQHSQPDRFVCCPAHTRPPPEAAAVNVPKLVRLLSILRMLRIVLMSG